MTKISVVNKSKNPLPSYQTSGAAGMDVRADLSEPIVIPPMGRVLVPTGLYLSIPDGYEAQIRPRSGLALKSGITVLNSPGTIDSDYRGEVGVILANMSDVPFTINGGDRICQIVFAKYEKVEMEMVDALDETERGGGGFGHTGI